MYRALLSQQAHLGIRMLDVKGSINLAAIPPDLQAPLASLTILQALRAAGWHEVNSRTSSGSNDVDAEDIASAGSLLMRCDNALACCWTSCQGMMCM